jgi:predicted transposase YdaD
LGKIEGRNEGRIEGRNEGRAFEIIRMSIKYHANKDEIITELVEELKMSRKQAEQYLQQYEK